MAHTATEARYEVSTPNPINCCIKEEATKNHYHGFVGEYRVADGQLVWKRGIFGVHIPSGFVT